jgi:hypothetical protein
MASNKESINKKIYGLLKARGYKPHSYLSSGESAPVPEQADFFQFDFIKDGQNYGKVTVSLDGLNDMSIYYGDDVKNSPKATTHEGMGEKTNEGLSFDDLRKHLKRLAFTNQLGFDLKDESDLAPDMQKRQHNKKEGIAEGYHPINKKASYSDSVPSTKIIIQHNKQLGETDQRFRYVEKIFVENTQGERFLLPTNKPGVARIYARHISEGGTPYDERGQHITSIVEEYQQMAGFVRATKNKEFNESAQSLVLEGMNHYESLRETLHKLTGVRGYREYFENYKPTITEDDSSDVDLTEMFSTSSIDPRIEKVQHILKKIHKKVKPTQIKQQTELEEWADGIIKDSLDLNGDIPTRTVDESFGLYGPFTATINTGERPKSRTKTKTFKREDDAILWAQDWLENAPQYVFAKAEVTDPAGNVVWTTDEGVSEGFEPGHREIERWATKSEENQKIYNAYIRAGKLADEAYKNKDGAAYTGLQLTKKQIRDLIAKKMKERGVAEGLQQTLRKYVPGYAKKQIHNKIKDQQFTQALAIDGDPTDPQNQKEINQTQRNIRRLNRVGQQSVAEGYSLKKTSVIKYMEPGDSDEWTQDVNIKDTDYEIINNKTGQVVGTASWTTNDFFGPGALKITMNNGATRWLDIWEREKGNPQTAFNRFVKDPKTAKRYKEQGVAEGSINTYILNVMDEATGEHWAIEIQATSADMAKERAQQQGFKVLRIREKSVTEQSQLNELSFEEIKSFYVAYKVITEWGIPLVLIATIVAALGIQAAVKLINQGKNAVVKKYHEIKGTVDPAGVSDAAKKIKNAGNKNKEDVAEASPEATMSALRGYKTWQVWIKNNYYNGKYADYSARPYNVIASSAEEAKRVVLDNADYVLKDLLSKKFPNGRRVLPPKSALPVEEKRIGKIEDGTVSGRITTSKPKTMLSPQGPVSVMLDDGEVVDVVQGVAEGGFVSGLEKIDRASDTVGYKKFQHALSADPAEKRKLARTVNRYNKVLNKPKNALFRPSNVMGNSDLPVDESGVAEGAHWSDAWEPVEDIKTKTGKVIGMVVRHDNGTYAYYDERKGDLESGFSSASQARQAFVELHNARVRSNNPGVAESKIQYGVLDHTNVNLIINKSESKPDGVYSFRGILFRVKGGKVTHWATDGKILQAMGRFNTQIGSYSTDAKAKALLKSIKEGVAEVSNQHISPSGVKTNMDPSDDDYDINYGKNGLVAKFRKAKGMSGGSLNEFAPDGFDSGDGDEFSPEIAKMAQDDGFTKGASLADSATLERAMSINHWHNQHGGMYKQYFAKGFKAGRLEKIRHDNKQYNLNLKLMKDGSIRRGEQGVAEGLGKTIKRGMAGWGAFDKDKPADVVKRVRGQDTDTLKSLSRTGPTGKGSPAELQQKAIGRELKKRGEQGVAEGQEQKKPLRTHKSGCGYNYGHDCDCGGTLTHASNCHYNYGHDCDCGLDELKHQQQNKQQGVKENYEIKKRIDDFTKKSDELYDLMNQAKQQGNAKEFIRLKQEYEELHKQGSKGMIETYDPSMDPEYRRPKSREVDPDDRDQKPVGYGSSPPLQRSPEQEEEFEKYMRYLNRGKKVKESEKIAGRYDPEEFDQMVQRVGQKAKKNPSPLSPIVQKLRDELAQIDKEQAQKQKQTKESLDKNQTKAKQFGPTDKVKTGPILGNKHQVQKGLKGKLVGESDELSIIKKMSGL